jgi:AraC-like DNA-binding protein
MRLGDAARMLAGGNNTVSEVSKAVGYSDSKVFTRAFTRKFGASPSQYQHSDHPIA